MLGQKIPKKKLEEVLEEYNESVVFDPSQSKLHYFHRDMIDEAGLQKQGDVKELFVKSHTYKAVLCCDTEEINIAFEDELKLMLCEKEQYLTTLHFQN